MFFISDEKMLILDVRIDQSNISDVNYDLNHWQGLKHKPINQQKEMSELSFFHETRASYENEKKWLINPLQCFSAAKAI